MQNVWKSSAGVRAYQRLAVSHALRWSSTTALYDLHKAEGGKMVDFAGWQLPVAYEKQGNIEEHMHTRKHASIFDVSHMLQLKVVGDKRQDFVERISVADVASLAMNTGCYSLVTNEKGGIVDDTIIHKHEDHIHMVLNAGCAEKDMKHLQEVLASFEEVGVELQPIEGQSLLALQGPDAHDALAKAWDRQRVEQLAFMGRAQDAVVAGVPCSVTRCGYTGEDGFEISVADGRAEELARALLADDRVLMAGLGARDTLRLEAGLPLYGHDLEEDISPLEAVLKWTITKRRRAEGGFLGYARYLTEEANGFSRKRVGLVAPPGRVLREQTELYAAADASSPVVGKITSGLFSPILQHPIAMAYVDKASSKRGTALFGKVGKKFIEVKIAKMPFVSTNYYTGK